MAAPARRSNPLPEGTLEVGVGLLVAGATAYLFLVVAARALGEVQYASLSVLWALVFLGGPGFFLPLEQEVSRALAARRARHIGTGPVLRRASLVGAVIALTLVAVVFVAREPLLDSLFDGEVLLLVGLMIALVGYCIGHLARGSLSGLGRFRAYSLYIGTEGVARFLGCLALALFGVSTAGAYGLALGLAPLVAIAVALRGQRDLVSDGPNAPWSELSTAIGWLLLGSVLAQALVNVPVLAVRVLATAEEATAAGRFQLGLVVARVPLFLFQAIQAALLPKLSALAGSGRIEEFRSGFRRLVVVVIALGTSATVAAFVIGPFAVRTLFGSEYTLDRRTLGLLAAASGAYMLAMAMAQAVIALGGHTRMALCWLASVIVFAGVTALGDDLFLRVEVGLLAGSLAAAVGMAVIVIGRIRACAAVDPDHLVEAIHDVALEP
ncbi:hypothetical protein BH18ACT4_BH18ACT4_14080 [soil metagenome]